MEKETDMEGKDLMVYGDAFSGGHPIEFTIKNPVKPEAGKNLTPDSQPLAEPSLTEINP